ncbi:Stp1/IreP family PP2C-type Ser/Thr phosphatase [Paratissierella segnis]|jgi:protein phosphatase|uniref:Stp1/IreP family PP2C-type Ser/Thr phosphatase n=1 Tax=Paratissierella segnis TaxID=2763679 RepID=A0A926IKT3_9FIRM|nr:Stp1/IreP family PP2C-type Ser/Thr phosphatase [Paratissierella segnis]MBC8588630.1 Stp1/IreP family PP2C-type Ser/Thr phosphatase [Paratissierella segnis]
MIVGAVTDIGKIRDINQDFMFVGDVESFPLYIVADGMGGHNAGEVASNMAVHIIKKVFIDNIKRLKDKENIKRTIEEAISQANKKIYLESKKVLKYAGMGTTITLAYIFNNNIYIGHVGDSRAYFATGEKIYQITDDHSLVNELIKNGSITPEEAINHPQKNLITRAVGTSSEIQLDFYMLDYKSDDILIICSDGLSNMLSDGDIMKLIKSESDVDKACNKLISVANDNGGRDNITVIAIKF